MGLSIVAEICGNDSLDSVSSVCEEHILGSPAPGSWDHWVVHSEFSHAADGSVSVWRNGASVLEVVNVVTSYRNTLAPTLAIGLYIDSWDTLTKASAWTDTGLAAWMEVHCRRVKVGGAASSYSEVWSGGSGDFSLGTEFLDTVTLQEALVRDIMPPSSSLCTLPLNKYPISPPLPPAAPSSCEQTQQSHQ